MSHFATVLAVAIWSGGATAVEGEIGLNSAAVSSSFLAGMIEPLASVALEPALVVLLLVGMLGMSIRNMFDSILSEEDDGEDPSGGGDDGLMAEEGGDDLEGSLGGLDDGGDEFGDFGDDEFGDMDGGADNDELEHRLDELENEVGSLSSTVNTVRNENEQISETVEDVEENVRKLLDIYEMVTRGVNPFADDIDGGSLGGAGDGSFGLFDNDESDQQEENLDEDIANADAEGFFDEDLVEDDDSLEADAPVDDVFDDEAGSGGGDDFEDEFDEDFEDGGLDESGEFDDMSESDSQDGGDGGKSFQELKDEYESGEADWAEEDDESEPTAESDGAEDADEDDELDEAFDDVEDAFDDDPEDAFEEDVAAEDAIADDDLFDNVIESEPDDSADESDLEDVESDLDDVESDPETTTDTEPDAEASTDESTDETQAEPEPTTTAQTESTDVAADTPGKPYLVTLPDGIASELIVIEWLEYLVGEVGVRETAAAIDYYERIDWISESVADDLGDYLRGFDDGSKTSDLSIDHHTQSLQFIGQLDGTGGDVLATKRLGRGGDSDGIQR